MALSPQQLKFFAEFIEKNLGIVYLEQNYFQLEQRLEKIASYLGLPAAIDVYHKASREGISGDFKQYLLDIATNNETSFFRDTKAWAAIETKLLPQLRTLFPQSPIYRIWCCAASFGQEPYSLAMLVSEFLEKNPGHPRIEIIATDIAEHALKRCRDAKYTQLEIQRGLPAQRMVKYFKKLEDSTWELKPEIKNLVQFRKQNLLEPFLGMGLFQLILCRYVLIYQDHERKKDIIERLEKCLLPKGVLLLGSSESAMGCTKDLDQVAEDGAIYYRKR